MTDISNKQIIGLDNQMLFQQSDQQSDYLTIRDLFKSETNEMSLCTGAYQGGYKQLPTLAKRSAAALCFTSSSSLFSKGFIKSSTYVSGAAQCP